MDCEIMIRRRTALLQTFCLLLVFLTTVAETLRLPNDKPFLTIWNSPTAGCNKYGLNLSDFDIIINHGGAFQGNNSIIYYSYMFDEFPKYSGGVPIHGGLPQLGNVTPNIDYVRKAVDRSVPNKDFNGIAVFDFESWRAVYEWNFDSYKIYQTKSLELVKQKHPDWNASQVYAEAVKEFDAGAEKFLGGTVNIARGMRPSGYWGYYAYPMCTGYVNNRTRCDAASARSNDKLAYLYAGSTGYFPRIYLDHPMVSYPWVTAVMKESLRVRELYGLPWTEIMPYSLYLYAAKGPFYLEHDLDLTVKQSADAGAGGIVFWGSSSSVRTKQQCLDLINYVDTVLGPYIKNLTSFVEQCSKQLCSNHGRCVVPDLAKINYRNLPKREPDDNEGYICQCYYQWTGPRCDIPHKRMNKTENRPMFLLWLQNLLTCTFRVFVTLYNSVVVVFQNYSNKILDVEPGLWG